MARVSKDSENQDGCFSIDAVSGCLVRYYTYEIDEEYPYEVAKLKRDIKFIRKLDLEKLANEK